MPTYEYACQSCGHRFDIWQEVGSSAPNCENCGEATKKVFHTPRVIFKGSGFYVTDLRNEKSGAKSNANETKTDSNSTKTETAKTETKLETKSDTTTPTKSDVPTSSA